MKISLVFYVLQGESRIGGIEWYRYCVIVGLNRTRSSGSCLGDWKVCLSNGVQYCTRTVQYWHRYAMVLYL